MDAEKDDLEESFINVPHEKDLENDYQIVTPERLQQEIERYQGLCNILETDQLELKGARETSKQEADRHQRGADSIRKKLEKNEAQTREMKALFHRELCSAREERVKLLQQKQELEKQLEAMEKHRVTQEEQAKVLPTLPERKMVFRGHVEKEAMADTELMITPQIWLPLPGGSALITFEEQDVAKRVIEMGQNKVVLDEGTQVLLEARPVELLLPSALEFSLKKSPRRVLLSGLPPLDLPEEQLLEKLELFFSKQKNDGGEVECTERLGSGHVTLTFEEDGVAERLVKKGCTKVPIRKVMHEIRVTPYVAGEITDLKFCPSVCARTVLLSGIPNILDEESTCEALEIHFQRPSQGGGEVDAVGYTPVGKCATAIFEEDKN
uniref:Interferon induced protein 35 n=1 Tax=Sphenodon punctatus TaxID=8508 RepID=A0A8D0GIL8_SPHPU